MENKKVPKHLALIPDGNRRWAKEHDLPTLEGHKEGAKRFTEISRAARERGVHTLTVWGFSTENWTRDITEIHYLMDLYMQLLHENEKIAHQDKIRMYHFGRKDRIPTDLAKELERIEKDTSVYSDYIFNLCIDYGGQDEIVRGINKLLDDENKKDSITKEEFAEYLDTAGQPHPTVDLLIRTSGEQRTSGLLPYQMAYAEFYFDSVPMPEFTVERLDLALEEYNNRERRFGGNSK